MNISVEGMVRTAAAIAPRFGSVDPADPFQDFLRRFGPQFRSPPDEQPRRGMGSGFIVSADGVILTNAHVVDDASVVRVKLTDKREFDAKVIGIDKPTDVAVLKIDAHDLPTVPLGNPGQTRVGDWVLAIGAPFGFENTVTAGIVSAKSRSLPDEGYVPFIQTDVAINPGNSGGPLVDAQGRVIGVNTAFVAQNGGGSGIGFAVPVNMARVIAERLRADGRVVRGWLGAALKDGDLGDGPATGALVHEVDGSSPARRAGLRQGDVLVALDGASVTSAAEVRNRVALARPGSSLQVRFLRDGTQQTATVRIGEKP